MFGGIFLNGVGSEGESIPWDRMRNDKYAGVRELFIKELNCKVYEIIPVSGYKGPPFKSRIFQFLAIHRLIHANFMDANSVNSIFPQHFRDLRAYIFIQIEFHDLVAVRKGYLF